VYIEPDTAIGKTEYVEKHAVVFNQLYIKHHCLPPNGTVCCQRV